MARKRIVDEPLTLTSWEDVNLALADIGERQRTVRMLETDLQEEIDRRKLEAQAKAQPHLDEIGRIERQIKGFVDGHREELGKHKSKELTFGRVSYRKSTKITLPKGGVKMATLLLKLRERNMVDCIITPAAKVDKDALKRYPAEDIVQVGASLQIEDVFGYEINEERLTQE